uniref:Uncharacterized protein n=1 Tax=Neobodo designis TaxID=312471 RepID=A0A7S1PQ28_NEODS|mmetsp:Transcript_13793/g.42936  ORF Transcript_13793/g.42936 Transcript_13793/m.42936 type:complete len:231 (+) Transcript_13793:41-733(+)|eukprot:CAMPEP_0174846334 /NCGR_PEP_ID=MMETSP1114-20130205/12247_1 /TAXON_ID=312471 /ORGANISM="Neobodo designis, Strain CCAP 1951/1" /LENGTH=230 /DNA_ID=CAMNT_0016080597 /DNA_START=38 /DNA_END=730 /DNA_ORIENTATION=+
MAAVAVAASPGLQIRHGRAGSSLGGDHASRGQPHTPTNRRLTKRMSGHIGSRGGAATAHDTLTSEEDGAANDYDGAAINMAGFDVDGTGAANGPTVRDRLAQVRYRLLHSPPFVAGVVLLTIVLCLTPSYAGTWPYFLGEAALTFLFCAEVALRMSLMRAAFSASWINVVEAGMCAVCVLVFAAMCVTRVNEAEHVAVVGLRLAAQAVRGAVYLHQCRVARDGGAVTFAT